MMVIHIEIIFISFNINSKREIYNIHIQAKYKYIIKTSSAARASGVKLQEAHGIDEGVNPKI